MSKVTSAQRTKMGGIMDLLVSHEPKVHYRMLRPMATQNILTTAELIAAINSPGGIAMDCSESVTLICRLAGLQDPSGFRYDGYGNTTTLGAYLPHYYDPARANVGALVLFPGHVCMVRRTGHDPILFSHGQERGPLLLPLSQERKFHAAPVVFLSIANLGR